MKIVTDGVGSFQGGVNTSVPAHKIAKDEFVRSRNARSTGRYGSLRTRGGSKRLHTDTLPAAPSVVGQWDSPGGTQEFAIANGDFWYKASASATFTQVDLSLTEDPVPGWCVHRVAGSPRLYFAAGGSLYDFDGSTVNSIVGAPSVRKLAIYKARGFGLHTGNALHGSVVDDLSDWSLSNGGLTTPIETYDAEDLNGLLVIGGSLIITKEDTVSRYSGVGLYDTRIETQTDGISAEAGLIAPETLIRVGEDVGFMLSDRGPYLVTESGVKEIGVKIEPEFDFSNRALWATAVASHNRRRKEIWLWTQNGWWVFNYRTLAWDGPWDYQGITVKAASRYERSSGQESVMVAGSDGRIRDGDHSVPKDDVLYDGTAGTVVPMEAEMRLFTFDSENRRKNLSLTQTITGDLGATGELTVTWEDDAGRTVVSTIPSKGAGVREYPVRPGIRGRKIKMTLADSSGEEVAIDGIELKAKLGKTLRL